MKKITEYTDRLPIFEILVQNKKDKAIEYVQFTVDISGDKLEAQHQPVSTYEENDDNIPLVSVDFDPDDFDGSLSDLYERCEQVIVFGDLFELV